MITAHLKYYRGLIAIVLPLFFIACEEVGGYTIDVHGPDIEFELSSIEDHRRSEDAFANYSLIAKSDSVFALNIEAFLSEVGQTFNSIVEKADLKNTKMSLAQDTVDYSGVESFLIKVRRFDEEELNPLCLADLNTSLHSKQLCFDRILMEPAELFKLIENGFEAFLYAKIQGAKDEPPCFQEGMSFEFLSGTIIAVKVKTGAIFDFDL